ncbi:MAG: endonuclease/exonuclease/phosphatase family protein [Nocardioides sp.]|uniref:endonuclease/exonuclease/phosphatase family protein n=1 Tax=Nocardioides sp. TaxID=35761 RepID=UPI0039E38AB3
MLRRRSRSPGRRRAVPARRRATTSRRGAKVASIASIGLALAALTAIGGSGASVPRASAPTTQQQVVTSGAGISFRPSETTRSSSRLATLRGSRLDAPTDSGSKKPQKVVSGGTFKRMTKSQLEKLRTQAEATANDGALGSVAIAEANIPRRSGIGGYDTGIHQLLSSSPDFVMLNEVWALSDSQITAPAAGYSVYRPPSGGRGGISQLMDTAVLYKSADWTVVDGGRVQLVSNDRVGYQGHTENWDRFATWVTLKNNDSGGVVSVISVHNMTNPAKYGPNKGLRQAKYGRGMDILVNLVKGLEDQGPVFTGGDFNVHTNQNQGWTATSNMRAAGYSYYNHSVDYIFYPSSDGVSVSGTCRYTHGNHVSDHDFLAARFVIPNDEGVEPKAFSC